MSDSVYSFRAGPTYRAASRQELFDSAMEQPLSLTSTFFDQAKGGMLESYGLGTAVRDFAIPDGAVTPETTARSALRLTNPLTTAYESTRLAVQAFREDSPVLDEAKYKSSPWYRENIPWDAGMTEARARALAEWNDAKQVRQYYAQKRPISAFLGNLTGQAFDPINYVPVGGPLVKAAAVARAGRIGGAVITGAVDAATNTALAGLATRETRGRFGDDVSFQAMVSEIATAALIGAAFGGVSGVMEARTAARALADAQRSLPTLKATQEARIALNEAIDGVVRGEDVTLSPNATEAVAKLTERVPEIARAGAVPEPASTNVGKVVVYPASEARNFPVVSGISYHGSPFAAVIDEIRPSQGGELGAGFYISHDGKVAAGYSRGGDMTPTEGVVAVDISKTRLKEITRQEYLNQRLRFYDEEQAKAGGEWSGDVARAGDRRLIEFYQEQGFDGIYDVQGRQGVIFPERLASISLKRSGKPAASVAAEPARPIAAPEGRALAETRIAKPDNYKALADQYRVDPETGDFPELADIDNLRAEGRLTADDIAELDAASATVDDARAYGKALKTVVGCLL